MLPFFKDFAKFNSKVLLKRVGMLGLKEDVGRLEESSVGIEIDFRTGGWWRDMQIPQSSWWWGDPG